MISLYLRLIPLCFAGTAIGAAHHYSMAVADLSSEALAVLTEQISHYEVGLLIAQRPHRIATNLPFHAQQC